jgi:hypothetical protein
VLCLTPACRLCDYSAQACTTSSPQVTSVVEQVEARAIMPPVMVLQLLATNPQLPVHLQLGTGGCHAQGQGLMRMSESQLLWQVNDVFSLV